MQQRVAKQRAIDSIKVRIEELVLHGFAPHDRAGIAAAVEQELAHLIGKGGLPAVRGNPIAFDQINGGTFKVKASAKPQAAGAGIARALFLSLRQHASVSARASRAR